ncbi:MAG: dihydroorotase, partial [Bacteroidota bacterium]
AGLADGTLSCITSGHLPEDAESKVVEFDLAHFGMLGLESAFALARTAAPQLSTERLVEVFCNEPRQIAGIEIPKIEEGATANFTLFAPDAEWTFEKQNIRSLSRNTPLPGTKLKGKVFGIYNRGQFIGA